MFKGYNILTLRDVITQCQDWLFHPLAENYLPPLWRRNSSGLGLLGLINPEP